MSPIDRQKRTWRARSLAITAAVLMLALMVAKSTHLSRAHAAGNLPWTVYVVDNSPSPAHVFPVRTDTNTPGSAIPVGGFPQAIAITPDSSTGWVVNRDDNTIQAIDTDNNTAGGTIPPPLPATQLSNPISIAITPDGTTAFLGQDLPAAADLATGNVTNLTPTGISADSVAVTPDGNTLYIAGFQNTGASGAVAQRYSAHAPFAPIGQPITLDNDNAGVSGMAVTPDGSTVYVVTNPDASSDPSHVVPIPTSSNHAGTPINVGSGASAIAITPDGKTAYVTNKLDSTVTPLTLTPGGGTARAAVSLPSGVLGPTGVAITPDGNSAYISAQPTSCGDSCMSDPVVTVLQTASLTFLPPVTLGGVPSAVAITPDQAPAANLIASPATAGQPTAFDASASTVKYGIITDYAWDFGDGSPVVHTSSATMSHAYAAAGTYNPSVTETDGAGTSLTQVFTGQTMLRNGGPSARRTIPVTIVPAKTTTTTTGTTTTTTTGTPTTTGPGTTTTTTTPGTTTTTPVTPTMSLSPTIGPPGQVVQVDGSGFAKNTSLTLTWNKGIGTFQARTDGAGGLHTQVLVLPHAELGPTTLVAHNTAAQPPAFLVVQAPGEPGGSDALVLYRR